MKNLILITSIILIGITTNAQPGPSPELDKPILEFETEIIDYGTIEQGSDGVREFKFTNKGSAPLIISEAKRTCGCTTPYIPKEPINPGESSIIKVKYDTKRLGMINKTINIISNAERPNIALRIKGKIIEANSTPLKKDNMVNAH